MIYLKPEGGLCNRLRSIESGITLAKKFNHDLEIFWITNHELNCQFESLFLPIKSESIKIKVVNCPVGFPENFLFADCPLSYRLTGKKSQNILRKLKNTIKGRKLDAGLNDYILRLSQLTNKEILVNADLEATFIKQKNLAIKNSKDLDLNFIKNIESEINTIMLKNEVFISSCYRIQNLETGYEMFKPTLDISDKIAKKTSSFQETYGLHIRRSDHVASKSRSTTEKFYEVINRILALEPNTTFFLSTDDESTKNNLITKFGDKIIFNEVTDYNRNSSAAIKDAVIDLFCLAQTKMVYGSHQSSFSQTAAHIGGIVEETVS